MRGRIRFIALEGVIGIGKTSLARLLVKKLGGTPVLEVVEENPFLVKFYEDRKSYAFQTQIFFLLSRYKQLKHFLQMDLFYERLISDYLFEKDKIFAYLNLSDNELILYEHIIQLMVKEIPKPDLVVYLQANPDTIMARIKERDRPYERGISKEYIEDLNEAYNRFFFHYDDSPLLIVNANEIDFIKNELQFSEIVKAIKCPTKGTRYLNF